MTTPAASPTKRRLFPARVFDWIQRKRESVSRTLWRPIRLLYLRHERSRRVVAWMRLHRRSITGSILLLAHTLGFVSSINVLSEPRTPQGAIAWIVTLNTFPYIAVPAYWAIGETDYGKQAIAYRARQSEGAPILDRLNRDLVESGLALAPENETQRLLSKLVHFPVTEGNAATILVDGKQTFDSLFQSIEQAKSYVLVEFYILRDDVLGNRLAELLLQKARQGVQVKVLYDEYGSRDMSNRYIDKLRSGGVQIHGFNPPLEDGSTTRLNFRNHRKLVIVDGREAFVGGHNIGDEYLADNEKLGVYRDTHVRFEGPMVQCSQIVFAEDWHAVTGELLHHLQWTPIQSENGEVKGICLPSGPADSFETASMFFLQVINRAEKRVWIASPYFVPDQQMSTALQLAALRGVDVRVIIPEVSDARMVWLSSFSYLPEMEAAGVKMFRYRDRFMHQKVILVDDEIASIGTANFDNRSFRLNFELMMVFFDSTVAGRLAEILEEDLRNSDPAPGSELTDSAYPFQLLVRGSRLLAPIQ
ncbi:cardiolipin synthase [Novipirellula sp. SH528]|uniref:cardiolipin synthase n=1 Tax=Novipirellula sp. SH528 TaxID=3454466 RepID=UPI003FA1582B